jgi:hypothetical protein
MANDGCTSYCGLESPLGKGQVEVGRFTSAIDELEWLLKISPEDKARALELLPEILKETKRLKEELCDWRYHFYRHNQYIDEE